jgi:hypothetical protein
MKLKYLAISLDMINGKKSFHVPTNKLLKAPINEVKYMQNS